MFTGIVQHLVTITAIIPLDEDIRVHFTRPLGGPYNLGDSVLVHGVCSTIEHVTDDTITVTYMPETLRTTTVEQWQVGQQVHFEPAATLDTPLSGWLVAGHVDIALQVLAIEVGDDYAITIDIPPEQAALVMTKGGLTLNGVNLTLATVTNDSATVQLVPYTLEHTTLGQLEVGDLVNIEFDYIAKLAQRWWQVQPFGNVAGKN